jgi:hypothetical protein
MKHSRRKSIYHKLSVCFVAGEVDLLESRTLLSAEPFRDPISLTAGTGTQLTNQPRFHWESPGAGVIRYDLFINRVGERSTPIYRAENIIGSFPNHETTDGLPNGEYEVWIRADFDDGGCTRWGKTPSLLSIVAEHPLSLFNPAQTSVQTYRPEFRWGAVEDVSHYEIWISRDGERTPVIRETGLPTPEFTPAQDLEPAHYQILAARSLE